MCVLAIRLIQMSMVIDGRLSRQGRGIPRGTIFAPALAIGATRRAPEPPRRRKQIPRKSNVTARHAVVSAIVSVCTSSYSVSGGTGGVHFRPRRPVSWCFRAVPPRLPGHRAAASFWNDRRLRPLVFFFSWITLGNEPPLSSALISLPKKSVQRKAWRSAATLCNSVPGDETPRTRITRYSASRNEDLLELNNLQESGDFRKESLVTTEENRGTKQ